MRNPEPLWYDSHAANIADPASVIRRVPNLGYTGVVLYPDNLESALPLVGPRLQKVVHVDEINSLDGVIGRPHLENAVIASRSLELLDKARGAGAPTCFRARVDDAPSLHEAIEKGRNYRYLMVSFKDPTNIPLELVIASLQSTETVLIKEITDPNDVDDAVVTLGVMEVGADGVMYSPRDNAKLDAFLKRLDASEVPSVKLEPATIVRTVPVGMGYRSCIDLATLFSEKEGMIVGSTSQGGILCCPEVFFLPYMELRPFRINAGAVHSYVYNSSNLTNYMTELRAGSPVMIVGTDGKSRAGAVGRMKTEVRPLRLIEADFASGERINILMQDDWHVRIFSADGLPLNITELKAGDKVLAHPALPGRHVGIKVEEQILEN